jgi:hypothetical protein
MTQPSLIVKPVPETDWPKLTSEAAAIKYACERSGLQDKSIAIEIGTDSAILSRAKVGQVKLADAARNALMDVTGCEAPLVADLLMRGYDPRSLRKRETETERALRMANEALDAERVKVRVLTEALRGVQP